MQLSPGAEAGAVVRAGAVAVVGVDVFDDDALLTGDTGAAVTGTAGETSAGAEGTMAGDDGAAVTGTWGMDEGSAAGADKDGVRE